MTDTASTEDRTVLICRAPHPRADQDPRFAGRVHGVRLQVVPFAARPTYRTVRDWSEAAERCLAVRCHACRAFTEYEVIGSPNPRRVLRSDVAAARRSTRRAANARHTAAPIDTQEAV